MSEMWSDDRTSTVYVSQYDKDKLVEYIQKINDILSKYPASNDWSDQFITTMSWVKTKSREAQRWIEVLDVKKGDGNK